MTKIGGLSPIPAHLFGFEEGLLVSSKASASSGEFSEHVCILWQLASKNETHDKCA
jgi:hypothetical protein